jgi:hypothetical protein
MKEGSERYKKTDNPQSISAFLFYELSFTCSILLSITTINKNTNNETYYRTAPRYRNYGKCPGKYRFLYRSFGTSFG